MYSTNYLYDCEVSEFENLPYKEALIYKLEASNELFNTLYLDTHFSSRDEERIDAVFKARSHVRKLLAEIIPGYVA